MNCNNHKYIADNADKKEKENRKDLTTNGVPVPELPVRRRVYLLVVRPQNDPATEGVAQVDHARAAAETQHLGEGRLHRKDQDLEGHKEEGRRTGAGHIMSCQG